MTRTKRAYNYPSFWWYRVHYWHWRAFRPEKDSHIQFCMGRCPSCRDNKSHKRRKLERDRYFIENASALIEIKVN